MVIESPDIGQVGLGTETDRIEHQHAVVRAIGHLGGQGITVGIAVVVKQVAANSDDEVRVFVGAVAIVQR